jgi:transposase
MPPQPEHESMDQSRGEEPEGAPACAARNADAGAPSGGVGPERRFSARRKLAAVTRLLRGEPLETVARELNVTVARLSGWRDRALVAAEAAMKERERDGRDEELLRLKAKLGEVTMANELLERKVAALEGGRPLGRRRPRR